jgi:hypothetical protein
MGVALLLVVPVELRHACVICEAAVYAGCADGHHYNFVWRKAMMIRQKDQCLRSGTWNIYTSEQRKQQVV